MKRYSNYDRLMVLAHTPEFRSGLLELTNCFRPEDNATFAARWGVDEALLEEYNNLCGQADKLSDNKKFVNFSDNVNKLPLFPAAHDSKPVRVIRQQRDLMEVTEEIRYDIEDYPGGIKATRINKSPEHSDTRHLRDDRYLTIELDLCATKQEVLAAVGQMIDHYNKAANRGISRKKAHAIDHWYAYYRHVVRDDCLEVIASDIIAAAPKMFGGEEEQQINAAAQALHRSVQHSRKLLSHLSP